MSLKDIARSVRDVTVPREQLRRAHRQATIGSAVAFSGDPSRVQFGARVSIHGPTVISVADGGGLTGSRLVVGDDTYIGEFNNIRCAGAPIVIGSKCLVSQFVTLVGTNHGTAPGTPIVDQPWSGDGIVIGDDVWLGAGATVLPGARIGDGCVVAAGAVVRSQIQPGTIVGGAPAREIGRR